MRSTKVKKLERKPDSHKGQNGIVLVVGGSKTYVGAPVLAGLAALRAGCDLSIIAAPEKTAWAISALSPDLITLKIKGETLNEKGFKQLEEWIKKSDVILLGPGSGTDSATRKLLSRILSRANALKKQLIIDADALKMLRLEQISDSILTPHQKELEQILRNSAKNDLAKKVMKKNDPADKARLLQGCLSNFLKRRNVILLKGPVDAVITYDKIIIIKGGNAGMTVGGTGDILAGLCAGYLSQTHELALSATLASKNNKQIGDALLKKSNFGYGFIASDLLREIKPIKKTKKKTLKKSRH
jgi:NAD(P)H-hydrate epimerase